MSKKAAKRNRQQPGKQIRPTAAPPPPSKPINNNLFAALTLAIISLAAYANTLNNGFTLDDQVVITDNFLVKNGLPALGKIFTTPYHYGWNPANTDKLYRPMSLAVFAAVNQLSGLNPLYFHLVSVLLFTGCVISFFFFLDRLFAGSRKTVAFISALLFALHPIHTEVVANAKSCDELLCFLFAFLCMNTFISYVQTGKSLRLLYAACFLLLSFLSKETSFTFVVIIPAIFFLCRDDSRKRAMHITLCTASAAGLYLLMRYLAVYDYHTTNHLTIAENFLTGAPPATRVATAFFILGYYARLLLIPWPLSCDYSINAFHSVGPGNPLAILPAAFYAFLLVFATVRIFRNRKDPYAAGIFFFLINLVIFSNIPFLVGATMAERFLFFASAGYCLVLALLIERAALKKSTEDLRELLRSPKSLVLLVPVAVAYLCITISRNADWADNKTLYTHDLQEQPDNCRLNYFLGDLLLAYNENADMRRQNARAALPYLYKAISIYPAYKMAECDLGIAWLKLDQYDSAEVHYQRTLQIDPAMDRAMHDLGWLYYKTGRFAEAITMNKRALAIYPNANGYINIAKCFLETKQNDSAIAYLKTGTAAFPQENAFNQNLAIVYDVMGIADSAKKYDSIAKANGAQ